MSSQRGHRGYVLVSLQRSRPHEFAKARKLYTDGVGRNGLCAGLTFYDTRDEIQDTAYRRVDAHANSVIIVEACTHLAMKRFFSQRQKRPLASTVARSCVIVEKIFSLIRLKAIPRFVLRAPPVREIAAGQSSPLPADTCAISSPSSSPRPPALPTVSPFTSSGFPCKIPG